MAIRRWRPWEYSTGPRTPEGKRRSAMRGYKGGTRGLLRELGRLLREGNRGDPAAFNAELRRIAEAFSALQA